MSFDLYFLSAEVPARRRSLLSRGVTKLGFSYFDLRERGQKFKRWKMADNLERDIQVFVSPGIARKKLSDEELRIFAEDYLDFIDLNLDRITFATELDGEDIPEEMIKEHREEYWNRIDPAKFLPVWRGNEPLEEMPQFYEGVAIGSETLRDAENKALVLHVARTHQDHFTVHGLNITTPELLSQVAFSSASSTGWLGPLRYGETHIWEVNTLRRYPKEEKEAVRKRHARTIERLGLDPALVLSDDREEVSALSISSWLLYEEWLQNRPRGRFSRSSKRGESESDSTPVTGTTFPWDDDEEEPETPSDPAATRNHLPVLLEREAPPTHLPGLEMMEVEKVDEQGNKVGSVLVPQLAPQSQRVCNTCYVNAVCPAYNPDHRCAYGLPIRVRTREDLLAVGALMLETQTDRVMFQRFAEQLEGGAASPKVSAEIDRWWNNVRILRDISDNSEFMKITIEGRSKAGVLGRIFGDKIGQRAEPPQPPKTDIPEGGMTEDETDELLLNIMDAEVLDEE